MILVFAGHQFPWAYVANISVYYLPHADQEPLLDWKPLVALHKISHGEYRKPVRCVRVSWLDRHRFLGPAASYAYTDLILYRVNPGCSQHAMHLMRCSLDLIRSLALQSTLSTHMAEELERIVLASAPACIRRKLRGLGAKLFPHMVVRVAEAVLAPDHVWRDGRTTVQRLSARFDEHLKEKAQASIEVTR